MMSHEKHEKHLKEIVEKLKKDRDVLALILYGSYARGETYRDIDLCIVLYPEAEDKNFEKKLEYSEYEDIDVQIFNTLPLYIKARIFKEGRLIHCKDEELLYDIAIRTIKEYELFKPRYKLYLEGVLYG